MSVTEKQEFMDELEKKIEYLAEFMTEARFQTLRRAVDQRTRYITVCLENIFHPQNASAVVRTSEAFGLQEIHAIEKLTRFSPNVNIVRGTDKWIEIRKYSGGENPSAEAVRSLKARGYRIIATSPHVDGHTPENFDVAKGPFALVFGTEHAGVSDEIAAAADEFIQIPMQGMVESLNISVCAAILLYQLSRKVRESVPGWRLPENERAEILFRWMTESVKDSRRIMQRYIP